MYLPYLRNIFRKQKKQKSGYKAKFFLPSMKHGNPRAGARIACFGLRTYLYPFCMCFPKLWPSVFSAHSKVNQGTPTYRQHAHSFSFKKKLEKM